MSLSRTHIWSFLEKLTSAQLNAIDENVTRALDKRSGQTDTLSSTVDVSGSLNLTGNGTYLNASQHSEIKTAFGSRFFISGTAEFGSTNGIRNLGVLNNVGSINVGSSGNQTQLTNSGIFIGNNQMTKTRVDVAAGGIQMGSGTVLGITGSLSFFGSAGITSNLDIDGTTSANGDFQVGGDTFLNDVVLNFDTNTITYGEVKTKVIRQSLVSNSTWYRYTGASTTLWSDFNITQVGGNLHNHIVGTAGDSSNYKRIFAQILKPIDGATLKFCALGYKPASTSAPSTSRIRFNVYRYPIDSSAAESLFSGGMSEVSSYGSTAWASQTMTLNQNNTIDTENYTYAVIVEDDRGGNIGNGFSTLVFTYEFTDFTKAAV